MGEYKIQIGCFLYFWSKRVIFDTKSLFAHGWALTKSTSSEVVSEIVNPGVGFMGVLSESQGRDYVQCSTGS